MPSFLAELGAGGHELTFTADGFQETQLRCNAKYRRTEISGADHGLARGAQVDKAVWTCARELVGFIWATGITASHQQVSPHWGAATISEIDRARRYEQPSSFRSRPRRAASAALGGQRPRGGTQREARIDGTAAVGQADKVDREGDRAARDLIAAAKIVVPATAGRVNDSAMQVFGVAGVSRDTFEAYAYARFMRMGDGLD